MTTPTLPPVLYFGAESPSHLGHYLYRPGFRKEYGLPHRFHHSESPHLDGGVLKAHQVRDVPGRAAHQTLHGYSVVTWWDRSGDPRPASNSAFLLLGEHPAAEVLRAGAEAFPTILPRQRAAIILPDGHELFTPGEAARG